MKYVYLIIPAEGLTSICGILNRIINICKQFNRILVFNSFKTCYKVNFSKFFKFDETKIIYKVEEINNFIEKSENLTIYPEGFNLKNCNFGWDYPEQSVVGFNNENEKYTLFPRYNIDKLIDENKHYDVIIVAGMMGGFQSINFFKEQLIFTDFVINYFNEKYNLIKKPYLSIQVRNTDISIKSDYIKLYEQNKDIIHKYKNVYVATDCIKALNFFKNINGLTVYNFTKFPKGKYRSLHYSTLSGTDKIMSALLDLFLIGNSNKLLSNSSGGFIKIASELHKIEYFKKLLYKN